MKVDKKTIAYILIGAGVLAAIYYFFTQAKNKAAAGALGAGYPDTRGSWAAEDDALYNKFRNQFTKDLPWIDPEVESAYTTGSMTNGITLDAGSKIKGVSSKAGAFAAVIYSVAPNPEGTYPPVHWDTNQPSLWPPATIDKLYNDFNKLKTKYSAL